MKLTIAILITSICVLVAQDAPITPEQRVNLPVGGLNPAELVPETPVVTNAPPRTRGSFRRERRVQPQLNAAVSTNQPTAKPEDKQEDNWKGGPGGLSVQIKTNTVVHWVTVEEKNDKTPATLTVVTHDTIKQVGTLITNRVAVLVYDGGTNEVVMKTLGRGEWPSQVRTVQVPARYRP